MTDETTSGQPIKGIPLFTRFAGLVARTVLRLLARVTVEVQGELPKDGPLIVVANHLSNADPPLVAGWLTPLLGRQLHILAKEALFFFPLGFILRQLGATPVKSGGSDIEAYRVARSFLDRGEVLCIFPEGTRSRNGVMADTKPGVAMLATREAVPVLPVGVSGTDRFLGRGARFPRLRAPVTLRVGRPFTVSTGAAGSRREALENASDEIMRRIAELVDERHRGRYGTPERVPDAPV